MTEQELFDWLATESVANEVKQLKKLTVAAEIDNLILDDGSSDTGTSFDWERLVLAGSILARSTSRRHLEVALRIATSALTLAAEQPVKDAGAILLGKLSNQRAAQLAEDRDLVDPDLTSRLGVFNEDRSKSPST